MKHPDCQRGFERSFKDGGWNHRAVGITEGIDYTLQSSPRTTKEGAMDHSNKAHRMTDEELREWNRDPLDFVRGILIAAAISLLFWAAVVVLWVIF